jgi:hypothetical protein
VAGGGVGEVGAGAQLPTKMTMRNSETSRLFMFSFSDHHILALIFQYDEYHHFCEM